MRALINTKDGSFASLLLSILPSSPYTVFPFRRTNRNFRGRGSNTIQTKHLQTLLLEVYKSLTSKNPSFLWDLFERRPTNYNLRKKDLVQLPSTKTVMYRLNSLRFIRSMLWNTLPYIIKSAKNDRQFKNRIKDWTGSICCIKYISIVNRKNSWPVLVLTIPFVVNFK